MLPFDELNILRGQLEKFDGAKKDEIVDELLDIMILSYVYGVHDAGINLDTRLDVDFEKMRSSLYKKYDGKDSFESMADYLASDDMNGAMLVADTQVHRVYNSGLYDGAKKAGAKTKTWRTMLDTKVRDEHDYLEGQTVNIDADFYTYTGAHAPYPGEFGDPQNDCNCRCYLTFSK